MSELLVYGSGGFGREVAWLAEQCGYRVVGFVDDDTRRHGLVVNELPVVTLQQAQHQWPAAAIVGGIGSPPARKLVLQRAEDLGLTLATLVHPRVERSARLTIGAGTVICAGCILTTNITLGRDVQINLDCTVGHDVIMQDHVTIAPGVHVSGCVHIEEGAYIGTGANIINGDESAPIVIGAGSVVGAGACVTRSVQPGVTVVGIPAKARPTS